MSVIVQDLTASQCVFTDANKKLVSVDNATVLSTIGAAPALSLTQNYIPVAASATTLKNSLVQQGFNGIGIGGDPGGANLAVISATSTIINVIPGANAIFTSGINIYDFSNTHRLVIGQEGSGGGSLLGGSSAYAGIINQVAATKLQFGTNNTVCMTIDGTTGYVSINNADAAIAGDILSREGETGVIGKSNMKMLSGSITVYFPDHTGATAFNWYDTVCTANVATLLSNGNFSTIGRLAANNSFVSAYHSSALSIANTGYTTMLFATEVDDALGEYDPATGIFTASRACKVQVSWCVAADNGVVWVANEYWSVLLSKGDSTSAGSCWGGVSPNIIAGYPNAVMAGGSIAVNLALGDTLRVKVAQTHAAGAVNTLASGVYNYLSIVEIP